VPGLLLNDRKRPLRLKSACSRTNQREGNGSVALLAGDAKGAPNAAPNRPFWEPPEQTDTCHMDDGSERQSASTGLDLTAERNRPVPRQLAEWFITGPALQPRLLRVPVGQAGAGKAVAGEGVRLGRRDEDEAGGAG
jgi:hypothetical protein